MRYLGAIILIASTLSGCAARRPVATEIVIPKECLTGPVICTIRKTGQGMKCRFDKLVGCEQVRVHENHPHN